MPRRVIPFSIGPVGLLLVTLALALPDDFASRGKAEPAGESASIDKRIAGEAALFVTFRPDDFSNDELAKTILQEAFSSLEEELHVRPYGIERLTMAIVRQGPVMIVQTKKPYDAQKMRESTTGMHQRFKDKKRTFKDKVKVDKKDKVKDGRKPAGPVLNEKKVGGYKIYHVGEFGSSTKGFCPINKNTFLVAEDVTALDTLLGSQSKPSTDMAAALALRSKFSLVAALDGKRVQGVFRHMQEEQKRQRREWRMKMEQERLKEKVKEVKPDDPVSFRGSRKEVFVSAVAPAVVPADKAGADDDDDVELLFGESMDMELSWLPYRPLLAAKFSLLTLDFKKTLTLRARIEFHKKAHLDDGESSIKSFLYVLRQLAGILPRQERGFRGMKALTAPVKSALENARFERQDTTITTTITLKPEASLTGKLRDGIAAEKSKQEARKKKREKERSKRKDKDIPDEEDVPDDPPRPKDK